MLVNDGNNELKDSLSAESIRNLFSLNTDTDCDTHDLLQCARCTDAGDNSCRATEQLDDDHFHENGRPLNRPTSCPS